MQILFTAELLYIFSGRPSPPSPGVHKTVFAGSGTDHTIWGANFLKRDRISRLRKVADMRIFIYC